MPLERFRQRIYRFPRFGDNQILLVGKIVSVRLSPSHLQSDPSLREPISSPEDGKTAQSLSRSAGCRRQYNLPVIFHIRLRSEPMPSVCPSGLF